LACARSGLAFILPQHASFVTYRPSKLGQVCINKPTVSSIRCLFRLPLVCIYDGDDPGILDSTPALEMYVSKETTTYSDAFEHTCAPSPQG